MLDKHQEQYHSEKVAPVILQCEQCKFIATIAASLELHQIVHNTKPPYQCTECDYHTFKTSHFNAHVLARNTDRPHSCPNCNKCFTISGNLKRHNNSQHSS